MMNLSHKILISIAGLLCLLPAIALGAQCKQPAIPAGLRVQMIAPDMRNNGMETNIRAFNSPQPVGSVLTYYRDLWAPLATSERPGSLEHDLNEWKIISTVEGDCFTTVQVRTEASGSYALVSVIKKPGTSPRVEKVGAKFPILPGSKIVNDFEYADGVRNARTIVASNRSNLAANLNFYKNEFKARGWTTITESQPESREGVSHVMVLKKGLEEASIVISRADGQVQIVANMVDRP
jgi:hypothetical protein